MVSCVKECGLQGEHTDRKKMEEKIPGLASSKLDKVQNKEKEEQETVALLWRPHSLIPATIKSMRPELWLEYEKLVQEYKKEGWGIYDDSADMERAVILSDAYYGDGSSVVKVYQETGKTIMIQNVEVV